MDRRSVIKTTGLAGILAASVAPAVHAQQAIRWRMASSFPKNLDTIFGASEVFSQQVKLMSGGKFEISVHPAGEIMPALGVFDGVQQGSVECAHTASWYFFGKNEALTMGTNLPFGMNTRQMTAWMMDGNGLKLMRELYAKYNIINFPGGNTCAQMGGWFRKEIKSAADFKGLKFRIGGFTGKIMERLGVVPQNIPGGDIYPALEKGTIDAAEWIGPYDDLKLGFHKVAPNYYYPGFWEGTAQVDFFFNDKAFNSLPAEYKAIIENASAYAHQTMIARYDSRNPNALKQLVGMGAKLKPFPQDLLIAAKKTADQMYQELNDKNDDWKKIYADYSKFSADAHSWFRFTETQFDRFMQTSKS
jgi:TRAP-type mannitol/chloroaromatic compound transport system substrate-binding protein